MLCDATWEIVNIPLTKEFKIDMALFEIPVSGWTCLRTKTKRVNMLFIESPRTRLEWQEANLCRCTSCKSPFWSCEISSFRQRQQAPSFRLPSSQRGLFLLLAPFRRWLASSQLLLEAFWRSVFGVSEGSCSGCDGSSSSSLLGYDEGLFLIWGWVKLMKDGKRLGKRRGRWGSICSW